MKDRIFKNSRFILPLLIIACSIFLLKDYFFPQLQIVLALMVAPFVFRIRKPFDYSNRYFYLALIFITAYYFLTMKLLLFLGLGCFLFYSIESRFGKTGLLPFIFLICISPALHYVVTVFTFSLRLALSHYAADLLNSIGYAVTCNGNYFILSDGFTFNVDKACLGLNMFNTGLALITLLVGLTEKKLKKHLPFFYLCGAFLLACALLILTNFLRILTIVFFRSLPGTVSHELIGIFSMILYMAVPMYFIIHHIVNYFGREEFHILPENFKLSSKQMVFPFIAFSFIFFSFSKVQEKCKNPIRDDKLAELVLPGFSKEKKQDGVMEFRRDSMLVYIKPAVKPFESDHPPVLCWRGSGFDVEQVSELEIANTKILIAIIKKGTQTQYTAWWYDNGKIKTTDQWIWRLSNGEPFRIINITTTTKDELLAACNEFLRQRLF